MFDTLRLVDLVVGLIITTFTVSAGLLALLHRRMRTVATDVAGETRAAQADTAARMDLLDADMGRVRVQVTKTAMDVDRLNDRVGGVELTLQRVAQSADVAVLRAELAELKGTTVAKLDGVAGAVDTLYQAALRASQNQHPLR